MIRAALPALLVLIALQSPARADPGADRIRYAARTWVVEAEHPAGSRVWVENGQLRLRADKGLTLWLAAPLRPPYEVSYRREILPTSSPDLRLSDMNQFWAARLDPAGSGRPFSQSGAFAGYDGIDLYYFGIGGNNNRTSRFRHYDGHGGRPLLQAYPDAGHRLRAGHVYRIRTVVQAHSTRVYIDGQYWFQSTGQPMPTGYFGLRLTGSDQRISDFKVSTLP